MASNQTNGGNNYTTNVLIMLKYVRLLALLSRFIITKYFLFQIKKSSKSEDVVVKLKNKELLNEIKSKKRSKKDKDENIAYGTFMKKSVLTQTGIVKIGEDCSDEETKPVKINVLSDEELFAACGGRTAHKYVYGFYSIKGIIVFSDSNMSMLSLLFPVNQTELL